MSKETVYKEPSKFSKSVGAGMKSVFGGGGKTYYVIEHKSSSQKYHAGQTQEIIIDYIELGRDSKCQVSFGDTFSTVSRRHAAITKDGTTWVLKQLSANNPTLINGRAVAKQWYLQNGDEIQLSYEGPKIGFLVPHNNVTGSIGFTKRLNLFRQQALRPYKQAIMALSIIFLVAIGALSFFVWKQNQVIDTQTGTLVAFAEKAERYEGDIDSLQRAIANNEAIKQTLVSEVGRLKDLVENIPEPSPITTNNSSSSPPAPFEPLFSSIYFIYVDKIEVSYQGATEEFTDHRWSGTGFLLSDKRFVTARHVTESWYFFNENEPVSIALNKIASNGGEVIAFFTAYSPDGTKIRFKSSDFQTDRTGDQVLQSEDPQTGERILLKHANFNDGKDWATYTTNRAGVIESDANLSSNLNQQDRLHVLGYPLGLGATDPNNISPIYGNCIVSTAGLQNGMIYITDRNFEQGNSGGPVFYQKEDKYIAVGLVSAGAGGSTGFIVPISAIR